VLGPAGLLNSAGHGFRFAHLPVPVSPLRTRTRWLAVANINAIAPVLALTPLAVTAIPLLLGVYARVLLAFYAPTAHAHGIPDGQTGTVTVIQRFGSGLQLNVHFHTLVLDGVVSDARPGHLTFHPAPTPGDADVAQVLATVRTRVGRLLARRQLEPADETASADPLAEASPVLAGLAGASV